MYEILFTVTTVSFENYFLFVNFVVETFKYWNL